MDLGLFICKKGFISGISKNDFEIIVIIIGFIVLIVVLFRFVVKCLF